MNDIRRAVDVRKVVIASVAAFFLFNVFEYLLHGVLLMGAYADPRYVGVWNPQEVMRQRQLFGLLSYMVLIPAFVRVYAHGWEADKNGLMQGLRYGLLAGALVFPYHALVSYMVYPVGLDLALLWIAGGMAEFVVLGAVVGLIYRPT